MSSIKMSKKISVKMSKIKSFLSALAFAPVMLLSPGIVLAFTMPTATSAAGGGRPLGWEIYQQVEEILEGPAGVISAIGLMVFGAFQIMNNWVITLLCVIAGTVIMNVENLLTAIGAVI